MASYRLCPKCLLHKLQPAELLCASCHCEVMKTVPSPSSQSSNGFGRCLRPANVDRNGGTLHAELTATGFTPTLRRVQSSVNLPGLDGSRKVQDTVMRIVLDGEEWEFPIPPVRCDVSLSRLC